MGYGFGVPMNREAVIAELLAADRDISDNYETDRKYRLAFVGGGSLSVMGYVTRNTTDVDALQGPTQFTPEFEKHQINFRTSTYINSFPYNWEDRVVPLNLDTLVIDYYVASLEDVVASKLSSDRPVDFEDVRNPAVLKSLDWRMLDLMPNEMRMSSISEQDRTYQTFLHNYAIYREEFDPNA